MFLESFIQHLNIVFSLKDLGHLHYFLGIEVKRDAKWRSTKEIQNEKASSCPTPMIT